MQITKSIQLSLYGDSDVKVFAKQKDQRTRRLSIQLINDRQIFIIPDNATARISFKDSSDNYFLNDCEIEDNKIVVEFTESMLSVSGWSQAEIMLFTEDQLLSSSTFIVIVVPTLIDGTVVEGSPEYKSFINALMAIHGALDVANIALKNSLDAQKQVDLIIGDAQAQADLAKKYAEASKVSSEESKSHSLTSIQNAYETAQDVEETIQALQTVQEKEQKVEADRKAVESIKQELQGGMGQPGGYATLNSAGNVEQNAGNALRLGGFSPEHFATSNSLQDLIPTINAKIEELTYDAEKGVLTATANGTNTSRQIIGLLSSVTEDTTSGDVYFNYRDGGQTVWHKGKDNFIQTAYLDNTSNEIVMVFVSGNEIRIDVASLIDVYDGAQSSSATVSVDNHVISCNVRISPDAGNIIGTNENGLYAQHQSLAAYSTTVQNDSKYLGINAKAKDSEKIGGKTEAQLNVNSANTATKLGTARSIIVDGVASGSVQFDGSADVTINLIHKNVPFQIAAVENNAFTWPTASCDSYVINNSNPVMVTLEGVTSGFYGILHVYGNKLDEAFLETQGYILPDYCKEIEILSSAECYEYIFASDGVKKSVTRAVIS